MGISKKLLVPFSFACLPVGQAGVEAIKGKVFRDALMIVGILKKTKSVNEHFKHNNPFKMKSLKSLLLSVLFFLGVDAASAQSSQLLNARDFGKKLQEAKGKIVLDVRTKSEYDQGHLVNATLIDYYKRDFKQQLSKLDKNKPVFVYCKAGGRSASAVEILSDLGFKTVYNLQGGINAWTKSNNPVIK